MHQTLVELPVHTAAQLAAFEKEIPKYTMGYSTRRCMAYNAFRMTLLQYHHTNLPRTAKCVLPYNNFIAMQDGVATLYRYVQDSSPGGDDEPQEGYDDSSDDPPRKRAKNTGGATTSTASVATVMPFAQQQQQQQQSSTVV